MPSKEALTFGDVVLVPFPFTNQTRLKKRPAVIVSGATYVDLRGDVVVMAVTSQVKPNAALGDSGITQWQAAGLLKPSVIKPVLATIEQSLIVRTLGQLAPDDAQHLRVTLARILG